MKDKIIYIETEKRKYPMCFNLNVMEEIQEEYGSLEAWGKIVEGEAGQEPKIKDMKKGFLIMINEGIDIENENLEENQKQPFINSKQLGRILTEVGTKEMLIQMKNLTKESTQNDNEKNV